MIQALLLALEQRDGSPACLERFCGLTLLERNLRVLRHCGVRRAVVVTTESASEELPRALVRTDLQAELVRVPNDQARDELQAAAAIRDRLEDPFLLLRAHFVYDRRAVEAVIAAEPDTVAVARRPTVPTAFLAANGCEPDPDAVHDCGLGLLRRSLLEAPDGDAAASLGGLTGSPQESSGPRRLFLEDIPSYVVNLRRPLPVACFQVRDEADRRAGWRILIDATQKGTLDWPARYLHPVPENALVRLLLPTPVTPNHVTVVSNLCAFAAIGFFWQGSFWTAVVLALAVGILDGVDGKLARVKLLYSKFGDRLDHVLDLIYEPLWYLAIGACLSGGWLRLDATPVRLGIGIVALYFADRATTGTFKRYKGVELFDREPVDRLIRMFGARRNTNVLILLAGLLSGSVLGALWAIFGLTAATALIHAARALQLWPAEPDGAPGP